jgi:hypothetical protein
MLETEFMLDIFEKYGLSMSRMLGYSKTLYSKKNKNHYIIFNARISVESTGIIWWGDLDLTASENELKNISIEIGEPLYVLYESDAYYLEDVEASKHIDSAIYIINENGLSIGPKGKHLGYKIKKQK